jgi:hypothetical protein
VRAWRAGRRRPTGLHASPARRHPPSTHTHLAPATGSLPSTSPSPLRACRPPPPNRPVKPTSLRGALPTTPVKPPRCPAPCPQAALPAPAPTPAPTPAPAPATTPRPVRRGPPLAATFGTLPPAPAAPRSTSGRGGGSPLACRQIETLPSLSLTSCVSKCAWTDAQMRRVPWALHAGQASEEPRRGRAGARRLPGAVRHTAAPNSTLRHAGRASRASPAAANRERLRCSRQPGAAETPRPATRSARGQSPHPQRRRLARQRRPRGLCCSPDAPVAVPQATLAPSCAPLPPAVDKLSTTVPMPPVNFKDDPPHTHAPSAPVTGSLPSTPPSPLRACRPRPLNRPVKALAWHGA